MIETLQDKISRYLQEQYEQEYCTVEGSKYYNDDDTCFPRFNHSLVRSSRLRHNIDKAVQELREEVENNSFKREDGSRAIMTGILLKILIGEQKK